MQTHFMFEKPQRTSNRFYGAVSARALSFVIVLHQVMRKLVTSSVPCRCNLQRTILHSRCSIYIYLFFTLCGAAGDPLLLSGDLTWLQFIA